MWRRMKFLFLIMHICLASTPVKYMLSPTSEVSSDALKSHQFLDIEVKENYIYLSSGAGLGWASDSQSGYIFNHILDNKMVEGGNPALAINGDVIAVSGSIAVLDLGNMVPAGTGVSYSIDSGSTWNYIDQPIEPLPDTWSCSNNDGKIYDSESECEQNCQTCPDLNNETEGALCGNLYNYISWGVQDDIPHLSVTTQMKNLAYDLDIYNGYVYSANWAGGLRRFDYNSSNPDWEVIPLPMDNQNELICILDSQETSTSDSYQVSPTGGNCDFDGFNHRPFSVKIIDDTIWVGTAGGINKGTFKGDCIDWEHFRYYERGFYDDWVIGFEKQQLVDCYHSDLESENECLVSQGCAWNDLDDECSGSGTSRLWALTWDRESEGEIGPPSFSDDGGVSWNYSNQLESLGVTAYNVSFNEDLIYLSTDQGLFLSEDGQFWEKFNSFIDYQTGAQVLSEIVYDAKVINNKLWVATNDGIAISEDIDSPDNWLVFRFWNNSNQFSAYPNPFIINDSNVINNQGHMRFVHSGSHSGSSVDIFDFSMDKVATLDSPIIVSDQVEFIWDGKTEYGDSVQNGVYFCRLNNNGEYSWVKVAVLSSP